MMDFFSQKTDYCFIASVSPSLAGKVALAGMRIVFQKNSDNQNCWFLSGGNISKPEYTVVINDQLDYSIENLQHQLSSGRFIENTGDSLVSLSVAGEEYFGCASDFWGIHTHYWFKNDDSFICSNNIFLVAYFGDCKINQKAIFERLFFLTPLKSTTWFEGVKRLRSLQSLLYDYGKQTVTVSTPTDMVKELLHTAPASTSFEQAIGEFFYAARNAINERTSAICLSAGSDSRTVLACARKYNMPIKAFSFGTPTYVEARIVEKLTKRLNIPWELIDISGLEQDWYEKFYRTSFMSSALINPYRTHYWNLYNSIPFNYPIFEGTLGSEFVKGDMAVNGVLSRYHAEVITQNSSFEQIIDTNFACLHKPFRLAMKQYLIDNYASDLANINTKQGFKNYQAYAFEHIPSRIFSGVLRIAAIDHSLYLPYLSKNFLRALFNQNSGFAIHTSLRQDFWRTSARLRAQAAIVRNSDQQLYRSVLYDRISFKEASELPDITIRIIMKLRAWLRKIRYMGGIEDQIDNSQIFKTVAAYVKESPQADIPLKTVTNDMLILSAIATVSVIKQIITDMRKQ